MLWPNLGLSILYLVALATYAGEPGIVEKIESRSVVTSPLGPRKGSISQSATLPIRRVPLPSSTVEGDGRALDRDYFADQLHEVGDRTALLAGINAEQRVFLFLRGPLIDVDHSAPVAFEYVSRNVHDEAHGEAGYIYTVDFAFFEMMRNARNRKCRYPDRPRSNRGRAPRNCRLREDFPRVCKPYAFPL